MNFYGATWKQFGIILATNLVPQLRKNPSRNSRKLYVIFVSLYKPADLVTNKYPY
jgi:hypothetical protein